VLYSNVAHTVLSPMMFLGVSVFYTIQGRRDRSSMRGWIRWSLSSILLVFVFLVNGGIPPALLSGCEVLICISGAVRVVCLVVVSLGIFVSGLWTLRLSADQGRRNPKIRTLLSPGPLICSCLLSTALPPLLI